MKRRISLMIVAGVMLGASGVNADPISSIPLMVCADGLTQNYSGLSASDTLARIDYNIHSVANCADGTPGTVFGNTGTFNLSAGTSSFQLCYNDAVNSLPKEVCDSALTCASSTCSFQVFQINSTASGNANGPGDCVNVVCDGSSNPTSWTLFSSGTLSF